MLCLNKKTEILERDSLNEPIKKILFIKKIRSYVLIDKLKYI